MGVGQTSQNTGVILRGEAALPGNSYIWTGSPLVGGEGDLLDAPSVQVTDLPLATVRLTPCTAQQASQQDQQRGRHYSPHVQTSFLELTALVLVQG